MKLTPMERRDRIHRLAELDGEYQKINAEYQTAKERFTGFTDRIPFAKLRNLLWSYPGMGYFAHHRMLTLICEHMKFEDEE